MELIQLLTSQLGVTDEQAQGGAGLLLKLAREKLGGEEFGQVAEAVPEAEDLIASAPEEGGAAGLLGGLASSLGGGAGQLGDLVSLAGGFKNLNLDSGMIAKFVPVIISFAQSKGGDAVKEILEKVLKQ